MDSVATVHVANTRVLVNGNPGRRIAHAHGLRQGDPISPILFVIIMEVLNSLIAKVDRWGIFTPLPGSAMRHRSSLYGDDQVVFVTPKDTDLACIIETMRFFAGASGLITSVEKCQAIPIQCSDKDQMLVLQAFHC